MFTRDSLTSLLNQNNSQTLEIVVALIKELTVFLLHQSFSTVSKKENNLNANDFKPNSLVSRIGTVPLPNASEIADLESKSCGSDVPSHSSASSASENQVLIKFILPSFLTTETER